MLRANPNPPQAGGAPRAPQAATNKDKVAPHHASLFGNRRAHPDHVCHATRSVSDKFGHENCVILRESANWLTCNLLLTRRHARARGTLIGPFALKVASRWQTHFSSYCQNRRNFLIIRSAPERIRTTNLLIRSPMLYPVELRAPVKKSV